MPTTKLDEHATAGIEEMDHEHAVELQMVRALRGGAGRGRSRQGASC